MDKQPDFYSLDFFSDANFWTAGDASTRRAFIMPLPEPSEFLGFGVLVPSNEVLFVARGHVVDHLGNFIARMEQEGAVVELHARPPLPDVILNEYIKGSPHEQRESERPPDPPTFNPTGQLLLRTDPSTLQSLPTSNLWPAVYAKRTVKVVTASSGGARVAFGLYVEDVNHVCWKWSFVAFLGNDGESFLDERDREGVTVESPPEPVYANLQDYVDLNCSSSMKKAA
jgi:hypothetical protein